MNRVLLEPKMTNDVKKQSEKVTIKIPRKLYDKLTIIIDDSGYNSVTDFVVYVLRDLVASTELNGQGSTRSEDMEQVKKRLKSLGYL